MRINTGLKEILLKIIKIKINPSKVINFERYTVLKRINLKFIIQSFSSTRYLIIREEAKNTVIANVTEDMIRNMASIFIQNRGQESPHSQGMTSEFLQSELIRSHSTIGNNIINHSTIGDS